MSEVSELVKLLGHRFIQRKDVKSWQQTDGAWYPDRTPMSMADFRAHLSGERTMGHYLLDPNGNCKLFAFDLDLVKHDRACQDQNCKGCPVTFKKFPPLGPLPDDFEWEPLATGHPRQMWLEDTEARASLVANLRCMAEGFAIRINKTLGIPVAIASTGGKGLHVYGFTGSMPASTTREIALGILRDYQGLYVPFRGDNFWRHTLDEDYHMIDIEVFPKQANLDGKELGNLMALPLGIHQVTRMPKFFVTTKSAITELREMDPVHALQGDLPWE